MRQHFTLISVVLLSLLKKGTGSNGVRTGYNGGRTGYKSVWTGPNDMHIAHIQPFQKNRCNYNWRFHFGLSLTPHSESFHPNLVWSV